MATSNHKPKGRRKKYPGFRPCLNHDILDDMFKNPVPELCPSCFGSTAKHQIQLVALNYCSIQMLRQSMLRLLEENERLKEIITDHLNLEEVPS